MKFTLSNRITFGYIIIILTALLASLYCILTLQHNKELDEKITSTYLPLYLSLKDLESLSNEISQFNTYLADTEDISERNKLMASIDLRYKHVSKNIDGVLASMQNDTSHSIRSLVLLFGQIVYNQTHAPDGGPSQISNNFFKTKYPDVLTGEGHFLKTEFDRGLSSLLTHWQQRIDDLQKEKEDSDTFLSFVLISMIIVFLVAVVIVYIYTRKTIVEPIIDIKNLIVTLGEGKPVNVNVNGRSDEIGKMIHAVSNLTKSIRVKSEFAAKVGQGNYSEDLELLSREDEMGRALVAMRDNLKRSVEEEKKRTRENNRLAMVVNKTTNIVILADNTGKIEWVNPAFTRITGYQADDVIGKSLSILIHNSNVDEQLVQFGQKMMYEGQGFKDVEIISHTRGGTPYWLSLEVQPILGNTGHIREYIIIGTDITDRKIAQKNLEERNTELEKTNSELDRFVYSASHDLRAPIASLLGLIEVARLEDDPRKIMELLDKQRATLFRLDLFIRDIVNYSRNSRLEVEAKPIDFEVMIRSTLDQLQYLENVQRIRKIISVNQLGQFYSSPTRISMVLNNLIANAIKYADLQKTDPFLKIDIRADESYAEIRICDNGEGIPEDAQEKIFNMFYRASVKSSGSGLGLYIAKEALQKIGGTIRVESEYGMGTEFKIAIPSKDRWS